MYWATTTKADTQLLKKLNVVSRNPNRCEFYDSPFMKQVSKWVSCCNPQKVKPNNDEAIRGLFYNVYQASSCSRYELCQNIRQAFENGFHSAHNTLDYENNVKKPEGQTDTRRECAQKALERYESDMAAYESKERHNREVFEGLVSSLEAITSGIRYEVE